MRKYKYALVLDTNNKWYVRRIRTTIVDLDVGVTRYECDKPLGNDLTLPGAIRALNKAIRRKP